MPKQRRYKHYYIKDFGGGENTHDAPHVLMDSELSAALNVVPTLRGAVQRRAGVTDYSSATTYSIGGLARFYRKNGTALLVGAIGPSTFYQITDSVAAPIYSAGYTDPDAYVFSFAQYLDRLYFAAHDPADGNRAAMGVIAEDPSAATDLIVWKAGTRAPTKTGTAVASAGGNLDASATYKYKIAYGYGEGAGFGESNPGPAVSINTTPTNKTITLTFFGSGLNYQYDSFGGTNEANENGVDKVYIYRTEGGGSDYYLLTTKTTGASYEDSTSDADLTAAITLPESDNYGPDAAKHLCMFEGQMFAFNLHDGSDAFPYRCRWSRPLYPDAWPFDNYLDAPAGYGAGQRVAPVNGAVYLFYESAIVRLTVHPGSNCTSETVTTSVGLKHPDSLAIGRESGIEVAYFWAQDNMVYAFDGTACKPIGQDVAKYLSSDVLDPSASHKTGAVGGWDGKAYHLAWTVDAATDYVQVLRYCPRAAKVEPLTQFIIGTWWPQRYSLQTDKYPVAFCRFDGGTDNNEFVFAQKDELYTLDTGNDDDGVAINAYSQSPWLDCGTPDVKKFEQIIVVTESDTALTLTWETDGREGTWGSKTGSKALNTGSNPKATVILPSDAIGRHIRVKVEGTDSDAPWAVYSLDFGFEILDAGTGTHG